MTAYVISIIINVLAVAAFILDRIYRINSIKEYKEAKEAQILALKERIDFLSNNDDDFLSKKLKERIETMKQVFADNEVKGNKEISEMISDLESKINQLEDENSRVKIENSAIREAFIIALELFALIADKASSLEIPLAFEETIQNEYVGKLERLQEIATTYKLDK
jgi:lysyl-tRNA synthetase class I